MNRSNVFKYLGDGLLIIFSVLFALYVNRCSENNKTKFQKNEALQSILKELKNNAENLKQWRADHKTILAGLNAINNGEADSLKLVMTQGEIFNLGVLNENKPIVNSFLINASWETAKNSGIVGEFDFPVSQGLTQTYVLQDVINNITMRGLINLYFDKETHNMKEVDQTLFQFNMWFQELVGQEQLLNQFYEKSIVELEKQLK